MRCESAPGAYDCDGPDVMEKDVGQAVMDYTSGYINIRGLTVAAEAALRHLIRRVEAGHLSALAAGEQVAALGFLMIGTAQSLDGRLPGVPYSNMDVAFVEGLEPIRADWRPRIVNERGGVVRVVRAGRVALPTIISAIGGDTNNHTPRQDLLREGVEYDMGTHAWRYQPDTGQYRGTIHEDLLTRIASLDPGTIIGWGDVAVAPKPERMVQIPGEPHHYGIRDAVETIATYPVRAHDVTTLSSAQIRTSHYTPVPL